MGLKGEAPHKLSLQCKAGLVESVIDASTSLAKAQVPHNFHVHSTTIKQEAFLTTQPGLAGKVKTSSRDQAYSVVALVDGMNFVMVELSSLEDELAAVGSSAAPVPNKESLIDRGWDGGLLGCYFFVVTERPEPNKTRIRTRMIEHSIGEDPATGSAACSLACFLSHRDGEAGQAYEYEITQGVEMGRRSLIRVGVKLDAHGDIEVVFLSGTAVKVMDGKLVI